MVYTWEGASEGRPTYLLSNTKFDITPPFCKCLDHATLVGLVYGQTLLKNLELFRAASKDTYLKLHFVELKLLRLVYDPCFLQSLANVKPPCLTLIRIVGKFGSLWTVVIYPRLFGKEPALALLCNLGSCSRGALSYDLWKKSTRKHKTSVIYPWLVPKWPRALGVFLFAIFSLGWLCAMQTTGCQHSSILSSTVIQPFWKNDTDIGSCWNIAPSWLTLVSCRSNYIKSIAIWNPPWLDHGQLLKLERASDAQHQILYTRYITFLLDILRRSLL